MKKFYEAPAAEITVFANEEIMTTSGGLAGQGGVSSDSGLVDNGTGNNEIDF
jgi:hypothetical protein